MTSYKRLILETQRQAEKEWRSAHRVFKLILKKLGTELFAKGTYTIKRDVVYDQRVGNFNITLDKNVGENRTFCPHLQIGFGTYSGTDYKYVVFCIFSNSNRQYGLSTMFNNLEDSNGALMLLIEEYVKRFGKRDFE